MTTDTKALTERIAEALFEVRDDAYDLDEWEDLDSTDRERWMCDAAAVLPIVEAEVRKAKAEVLREAAARVYASFWWADGSDNYAYKVRGFIGALAAEYETGGQR